MSSYFLFPNSRFFRVSFAENSRNFKSKFKLKLSFFCIWTLLPKKYSLRDIFCKLLKKCFSLKKERKEAERTLLFFFFQNNIIEWKFPDFPSLAKFPAISFSFPGHSIARSRYFVFWYIKNLNSFLFMATSRQKSPPSHQRTV